MHHFWLSPSLRLLALHPTRRVSYQFLDRKNDEKCSRVATLLPVEYITDALIIEGRVFQQCAENSYNGMPTILRQLFPARYIAVEQC